MLANTCTRRRFTEVSELRVQAATRVNERVSTLFEGVCVFVAVRQCPRFSQIAEARAVDERSPLHRGRVCVVRMRRQRKHQDSGVSFGANID